MATLTKTKAVTVNPACFNCGETHDLSDTSCTDNMGTFPLLMLCSFPIFLGSGIIAMLVLKFM